VLLSVAGAKVHMEQFEAPQQAMHIARNTVKYLSPFFSPEMSTVYPSAYHMCDA
jgi:hypothetical protein